jgi:hypothetical protein
MRWVVLAITALAVSGCRQSADSQVLAELPEWSPIPGKVAPEKPSKADLIRRAHNVLDPLIGELPDDPAFRLIERPLRKEPSEPAFYANRAEALRRVERDYDNPNCPPLTIAAWIAGSNSKKVEVLFVFALDSRREMEEIVVAGSLPDGRVLYSTYRWPIVCKSASMVDGRCPMLVRMPVEDAIRLAEAKSDKELVLTAEEVDGSRLILPQGIPLAVAVKSRSGYTSNFLPLHWRDVETGPEFHECP